MSALLDDLNPPQREAVLHGDGALLVLAGAGSGKTRVITRRIAHLVQVRQVPAWRILAVTFTNKAAREMRERLEVMLGPAARELTVSTFHSSAALILRREAEAAGLSRSFIIYDDSDQLALVKKALREANVELSSVTPRELLHRIDAEKNAGRMPDQVPDSTDPRAQLGKTVYRAYQKALRAANAVDFGDLLLLLVDLLRKNVEVRVKYQRRFQHVLVDEFQDTNPVQYQLLRLLAPPGSNLVVVGDDDQSIYRWRGADVDNILGFPKDYPNTLVVKLEQNYRSDQNILEAAYAVIAQNRRRMDKKLWSSRPHGEKLQLIISRDERGEAQEVAARIHKLRTQGISDYDQMAVFYRTNAQSRVLEETFRLSRVPYTLVSGRSFYDRAEIRDAVSYLRLMVNPRSDADVLRVINVPARGIGDTTVERLGEAAADAGQSLYEAMAEPERVPGLNGGAVKRLRAFRELIDQLLAFAATTPDATEAARFMLNQTQLVQSYKAEGSAEAQTRAENLLELLTATREFDKQRAAVAGAPAAAPAATVPVGALPSPETGAAFIAVKRAVGPVSPPDGSAAPGVVADGVVAVSASATSVPGVVAVSTSVASAPGVVADGVVAVSASVASAAGVVADGVVAPGVALGVIAPLVGAPAGGASPDGAPAPGAPAAPIAGERRAAKAVRAKKLTDAHTRDLFALPSAPRPGGPEQAAGNFSDETPANPETMAATEGPAVSATAAAATADERPAVSVEVPVPTAAQRSVTDAGAPPSAVSGGPDAEVQPSTGGAPPPAAPEVFTAPLALEAPVLQAFLEQVSLVGEADGEAGEGRVSLMTLHAAKGLEFDSVFMTGMEEDIFPHRRATAAEAEPEEMAEERRLCYVGFTRAKRRLHVSLAQQRTLFGELRFNPPSRFLSEVPKELFDLPEEPPPPPPRAPAHRRWGSGDDSGPVIDHSYDQSTDFHQGGQSTEVTGMRVQHSQFGSGVVLAVTGKGPNAKLQVRFSAVGIKTVIARFLTPG